MKFQPQQLSVITGFATIAAVLAGFGQTLLTDDIPAVWRPFAWIVIGVALAIQLYIASQQDRSWLLNAIYVILGFPIGIATNIVVEVLPANIKQTWTLVAVGAFLVIVLAGAAIGNAVHSASRLRGVWWGLLADCLWIFWGIAVGTLGGFRFVTFVAQIGGPGVPGNTIYDTLTVLIIPVALVGSIFASWMSGQIRTGIYAATLGVTLTVYVGVAYYYAYTVSHGLLMDNLLGGPLYGALIGVPTGFVGGVIGAGLRRVKWLAPSGKV